MFVFSMELQVNPAVPPEAVREVVSRISLVHPWTLVPSLSWTDLPSDIVRDRRPDGPVPTSRRTTRADDAQVAAALWVGTTGGNVPTPRERPGTQMIMLSTRAGRRSP
jgi:hypothetical protein